MGFNVENLQGATALDVEVVLKAYRGWAVVEGTTASSGTNDLDVDVDAGEIMAPAGRASVSSTTMTHSDTGSKPRKDVIYADNTGSLHIVEGSTTGTDEDDFYPTDESGFNTYHPAPPDMVGIDGVPLHEVFVDDTGVIYDSDIRDRRLLEAHLPINHSQRVITKRDPLYHAKAWGATGDGTTDDGPAIQSLFDAMNAEGGGLAFFPRGTYQTQQQVTLKALGGLYMAPNAKILHGGNMDDYTPALKIGNDTFTPRAFVDAAGGSGMSVGYAGEINGISGGWLRVQYAGSNYDSTKGSQKQIEFKGYGMTFDKVELEAGGNVAMDVVGCSDLFINQAIIIDAITGISLYDSEHLFFNQLDFDTISFIPVDINDSHDVFMDVDIWTNKSNLDYDPTWGIRLGEYDSENSAALNIRANMINHGQGGIRLQNIQDSFFDVTIANSRLFTPGNTIETGIEYGTGVDKSLNVRGYIDPSITTPIAGTPAGMLNGVGYEAAGAGNNPNAGDWMEHTFVENTDDNSLWWIDTTGAARPIGDIPGYNVEAGQHVDSGDGSTTLFTIPHNLGVEPDAVTVLPMNADTRQGGDWSLYYKNDVELAISIGTAPPSGTDNLKWQYDIRKYR